MMVDIMNGINSNIGKAVFTSMRNVFAALIEL